MRKRKFNTIKCPNCGREYLPAEIYVPFAFFGKPKMIVRDIDQSILDYMGSGLDVKERYICDSCNTTFDVVANISFKTYVNEKYNFAKDYSTKIKPSITMTEN